VHIFEHLFTFITKDSREKGTTYIYFIIIEVVMFISC